MTVIFTVRKYSAASVFIHRVSVMPPVRIWQRQ